MASTSCGIERCSVAERTTALLERFLLNPRRGPPARLQLEAVSPVPLDARRVFELERAGQVPKPSAAQCACDMVEEQRADTLALEPEVHEDPVQMRHNPLCRILRVWDGRALGEVPEPASGNQRYDRPSAEK